MPDDDEIDADWQHWHLKVWTKVIDPPPVKPSTPISRTLLAWPTVASVLYGVFGLMTAGLGLIFSRHPDEVRHFGFSFLGDNIALIGPPLGLLGLVQIATTPLRQFVIKAAIAALSVSFYACCSTHSSSPTAQWIYGCIALCHVLICYPKDR